MPDNFEAHFRDTFGRAPRLEAMTGYQAMQGIIRAAHCCPNPGNDRTKVIASTTAESPAAIR